MKEQFRLATLVTFGLAASTVACTRAPDIMIQNPIVSGSVAPNHILKESGWAERMNGLPPGTLGDEATLVNLDAKRACFDVKIKVLGEATFDFRRASAALSSPKGGSTVADKIAPNPAVQKIIEGLIAHRTQVGTTTRCADHDPNTGACRRWETEPRYSTVMVPGPIPVREESGQVCFPTNNVVNDTTLQMQLAIMMNEKGVAKFRWGFTGSTPEAPAK
jgi:hypothetical protein